MTKVPLGCQSRDRQSYHGGAWPTRLLCSAHPADWAGVSSWIPPHLLRVRRATWSNFEGFFVTQDSKKSTREAAPGSALDQTSVSSSSSNEEGRPGAATNAGRTVGKTVGKAPAKSSDRGASSKRATETSRKAEKASAPPSAHALDTSGHASGTTAATEGSEVDEGGEEHDEEALDGELDGASAGGGDGLVDEADFSEPAVDDGDGDSDGFEEEEPEDQRPGLVRVGSTGALDRLDPMAAYLREVQRHPLLSPEETHALAVRFVETQDPQAAARLVTANLRLVVKIAYEYRRAYRNIMDLVQEGNIGLMQAVKRYDPYRGVKLSSYAAWWIRAYILRFILNNWRLVKLGTTQAQRKLFFNLRKKRAELQAMGIDPSDAEVAKALNVPESEVTDMEMRLSSGEKSLDAPVGDSDGRSIARVDLLPSMGSGPEALMADGELQSILKVKLAEFRKTLVGKEKDLAIFDERLVAEDPLTLQELGDRFGVSRERVRQLEQRVTGKLREYLTQEMGDVTEVL